MMSEVLVSVILVCRNESKYIKDALISVLNQFEVEDNWELIIVDGDSTDDTLVVVKSVVFNAGIRATIINNPNRTLASGWNLGILAANGRFIIRPDAHAVLKYGYIKGALQSLSSTPAAGVVGGCLETQAKTMIGSIIKEALSMKSGVGNSSFRTGESSGYKDTAVYGLYRREVFDTAGMFNENLVRHQDTEFHARIINHGYKIFMNHNIGAIYYCRDSVSLLMKQMFQIGYYFSKLFEAKSGNSLRLRHWIPMMFFLFLITAFFAGLFFKPVLFIFYTFTFLYFTAIFMECVYRSWIRKRITPLAAFLIVPLMHLSYAAGTFIGILRWLFKR